MNIAVSVDLPQVAGQKPAIVAQLFASLLGHLPVASKDIGATHFDHANVALRHRSAFDRDLQFNVRQRKTDGPGATLTVVGVRGVHIGFGHAIAFQNPMPGAGLKRAVGFGQ